MDNYPPGFTAVPRLPPKKALSESSTQPVAITRDEQPEAEEKRVFTRTGVSPAGTDSEHRDGSYRAARRLLRPVNDESRQLPQAAKIAKGPDGTRGFKYGRGKPLAPVAGPQAPVRVSIGSGDDEKLYKTELQLADARAEVVRIQKSLETALQVQSEQKRQLDALAEKYSELKSWQQRCQELSRHLEEVTASRERIEAEAAHDRDEALKLRADLAKAESSFAGMQQEVESIRAELGHAKQAFDFVAAADRKVGELEDENQRLKKALEELRLKKSEAEESAALAQAQVRAASSRAYQVEAIANVIANDLEASKQEVQAQRETITQLRGVAKSTMAPEGDTNFWDTFSGGPAQVRQQPHHHQRFSEGRNVELPSFFQNGRGEENSPDSVYWGRTMEPFFQGQNPGYSLQDARFSDGQRGRASRQEDSGGHSSQRNQISSNQQFARGLVPASVILSSSSGQGQGQGPGQGRSAAPESGGQYGDGRRVGDPFGGRNMYM